MEPRLVHWSVGPVKFLVNSIINGMGEYVAGNG